MKQWCVLLAFAVTFGVSGQEQVLPLDAGWRMGRASDAVRWPAQVPGVVHTDLMRAGIIPDPYYGQNVDSVQWIEREDWVYEREVTIDAAVLRHERADLEFEGLDTFAEVYWNDSLLGRTDNMFRRWTFPVRSLLRLGKARLKVVFRSPVAMGRVARDAFGLQLPADNEPGPDRVAPYVRKAAYQFGWDMAPRLVTSGIWLPVALRLWDGARFEEVRAVPHVGDNGSGAVDLQVVVLSTRKQRLDLKASVVGGIGLESRLRLRAGRDTLCLRLALLDTARWWPKGEGDQGLFTVRVEGWERGTLRTAVERRMGLRSIALDQRPDSLGTPFTFVVNGRPVFMKGCNLVPPDMFLPRAGDSAWVALVGHMQRAHMNMVRVWAGGVYPPDAFFSACDTAGILVWQDLMFAALTPDDPAFIANAEQEVREQLLRWGHHPCLVLICGNNELDVAWRNWGWQTSYHLHGADSARVRNAYTDLFQRRLPALTTGLGVPYVHTSPLSNWGNAEGLRHGDLHYWGVWHGDSAFASFANNIGRFVSEYGFQAYPDSALLARYLPQGDLFPGSPGLRYRQRSYKGDAPILAALLRERGATPQGLGAFCRASQEIQAQAYGLAAQAHLDARPRCMGTLCWQLNAVWPGPSWSLIELDGRWRPAMFTLQAIYGRD